jgi:hypothetical protein
MGQDRAGFYTHNWVERLLHSGIPDVHELHPEWQRLEAGDLMRTNRDIGGKPMGLAGRRYRSRPVACATEQEHAARHVCLRPPADR